MKIRTCFVSNSSSCNFILIGCKISQDKLEKLFGENWYEEKFNDSLFEYYSEEELCGISLADWSEGGVLELNIDLDEIETKKKQVAEFLNTEPSNIKLLAGERVC